jgi:Uma2 family endonuclease
MSTAVVPGKRKALPAPAALRSRRGTPTWEIANYFPQQGHWSEDEFLELTDLYRIEYVDGYLEFLPVPTRTHHELLQYLYERLTAVVRVRDLGKVYMAGYRVRLRPGQYREPDVFYASKRHRLEERFAHGADLVIEVVARGKENRDRDLREKRREYAAARIPEYWIVDPEMQTITVLALKGRTYRVHGKFKSGQTATSVLLPGFDVDVTACFAASEQD